MQFFTKSQIEEIRKQIATKAVKDTAFPTADDLDMSEKMAIVQGDENRLLAFSDLKNQLYTEATTEEDGLMSSEDKEKLNGIEAIPTSWIDEYLI